MECGKNKLDVGDWQTLPNQRKTRFGFTAACPFAHESKDRIQIYPDGNGTKPRMWCRQCGALEMLDKSDNWQRSGRTPPPELVSHIDPKLPEELHGNLGKHREYFIRRGLKDHIIDKYRLGWHSTKNRYAIPGFCRGKISGIQYRIHEDVEAKCKELKLEYNKYVSEYGGVNNFMFNDCILSMKLPYVFVDESPLTVLVLAGYGYPAVSPFSGNNPYKPFPWVDLLKDIPEIVIVKQNDEEGEKIAEARLKAFGRGRIIPAPSGYKDVDEYLKSVANPAAALTKWAELRPPVLLGRGV